MSKFNLFFDRNTEALKGGAADVLKSAPTQPQTPKTVKQPDAKPKSCPRRGK